MRAWKGTRKLYMGPYRGWKNASNAIGKRRSPPASTGPTTKDLLAHLAQIRVELRQIQANTPGATMARVIRRLVPCLLGDRPWQLPKLILFFA